MVNDRMKKVIRLHWEQMVNDAYFYHGMSLNNVNLESDIVLDPTKNPHEGIIPVFTEYCQFLFTLIEAGLEFNIDDFYVEPLHKILTWTVRDIQNPGIDFTTNYADAVAYAFNYAGSQIKHNFNLIVKSICKYKQHSCFSKIDQQCFWDMTAHIRQYLADENEVVHKPVVVKVRRSCSAFHSKMAAELNIGSYDFFYNRVVQEAIEKDMLNIDKIAFFLHLRAQTNTFNVRLVEPLNKDAIEEIIFL